MARPLRIHFFCGFPNLCMNLHFFKKSSLYTIFLLQHFSIRSDLYKLFSLCSNVTDLVLIKEQTDRQTDRQPHRQIDSSAQCKQFVEIGPNGKVLQQKNCIKRRFLRKLKFINRLGKPQKNLFLMAGPFWGGFPYKYYLKLFI